MTPSCPRCNYDLSGLIATWSTACPLYSTCSECGLDFDCANVLSPRYLGPDWSFEHAHRRNWRCFYETSQRALRITRLTDHLRIDHAIRISRLGTFAGRWLLAGYLFAVLTLLLLSPARPWWGVATPGPAPGMLGLLFELWHAKWPYMTTYGGGLSRLPFGHLLLVTYLPYAIVPLGMLVFGQTFASAKVRRIHLLRGFVYSVPFPVLALHVLIAILAVTAVFLSRGIPGIEALQLASVPVLPLTWLWLLLWWWNFIRNYLKIRHAFITALLMSIQAFLVTLIVFLVTSNIIVLMLA